LNALKPTEKVPPILVDVPKDTGHGDLSTNIAMRLSAIGGEPPRELAARIALAINEEIPTSGFAEKIEKVQVEGPGYINFFLSLEAYKDLLLEIQQENENYGRCGLGSGKSVLVEFVSSNPTGPLSLAHARQGAVGDALANIMAFCGYEVKREYYVNDEGNQIYVLGRSISARYLELLGEPYEFPEEGYRGAYIYDIARGLIEKYNKELVKKKDDVAFFSKYGVEVILQGIKIDLEDFAVRFDSWFYQSSLDEKIDSVLAALSEGGYIYEKDGAVWFRSTAFGDDKDRVVRKSDGALTYLAPDIAYHREKYARGFDMLIDIFGPDHHGYIGRIKAAACALGHDASSLVVLIIQLATLYKGAEKLQMSTRAGEFITLRQLLDEVGKDAARFFLLARKIDSHLDFDMELAKKSSPENPVYYIQYAHARICSILEYREKVGANLQGEPDFSVLKEKEELALMRALREFPKVIKDCAAYFEPYGLGAYLHKLAGAFHHFYSKQRVVCDDPALTRSRLYLIDCTRIVLANGLRLLGISIPSKM